MSGTPDSSAPPRKSFAQVAAAANRRIVARKEQATNGAQGEERAAQKNSITRSSICTSQASQSAHPGLKDVSSRPTAITPDIHSDQKEVQAIAYALRSTTLDEKLVPPPTVLDATLKKDNSDTKSVTSRTTLTLDEKESLLPDDSASMQAAVEEDIFSPPGSMVTNSRQSSGPNAHAFRAQLNQIANNDDSRVIMPRAQRPEGLGMSEQQRGGPIVFPAPPIVNSFIPPQPVLVSDIRAQLAPNWFIPPDEKLLEALASPKDRLFVLKVEQDLIDFIKDPKEEFLQLPGTNSFYRMLSHKLADYYMLGHIVDDAMTSVRIFRTPHCRLPPPLIGSTPGTNNSTPPPTAQARKIMRRNRGPRTPGKNSAIEESFDSLDSSMATSDIGSGEESKNTDKGALTREERESRYKEARARIFKDFEAKEDGDPPLGPPDKGQSRSSSTSGVKKNKKQRRPKDDGFEARSAFDPYGRRLSENAFSQMASGGQAFEQYSFDVDKQFPPNPSMVPNNQGYMMAGYSMSTGSGQGGMGQWAQNNMSMPNYQPVQYPMNISTYGPAPYSQSNGGFENGQFSPQMTSDHTPKGTVPALSSYNQGYVPQASQLSWSQDGFMNPYQPQMLPYTSYGGDYGGYYQGQMMQSTSSGPHNAYLLQTPQSLNQNYYPDSLDAQQNFNPRSQDFVPGMQGNGNGQYLQSQSMSFIANPATYQVQRPSSGTINQASFNPNTQNARMKIQYATNGHRHAALPQGSSIAKWATPANLPAKPPPPANGMPDNQQALPPKPISTR